MSEMTLSEIIHSLHELEDLIQPLEEKYSLKSQDFYELAQAGELEESPDFIRWMGYYELWLDSMKEYRQLFWSAPHPFIRHIAEKVLTSA
jgi:hypothetical protein